MATLRVTNLRGRTSNVAPDLPDGVNVTGELRPIEGGCPFWNDDGRFVGVDWLWRDENGKIFAYTDREYFLYHFPSMLEEYIDERKRILGNQNETSLVIGIDFYHYGENWWLHSWGNWMPVHFGHTTHAYHNAAHYRNTKMKVVNHMSLSSKTI